MIEFIPSLVMEFLGELTQKTGWSFSIFGGGPCPEEGGDINTFSYVRNFLDERALMHRVQLPPWKNARWPPLWRHPIGLQRTGNQTIYGVPERGLS